MSAVGNPIEAVLTLNATSFHTGLNDAVTSVKSFVGQIDTSEKSLKGFGTAVSTIGEQLVKSTSDISKFNAEVGNMRNFNQFANGVKALATAIQILGQDASTSAVGTQRVINIIREMQGAFSGGTVEVRGLASALRELRAVEEGTATSTGKVSAEFERAKQDLLNLGNAVQPMARVREQADMMKAEFQRSRQELLNFARSGVSAFNQIDARSDALKSQMASMNAEFERSKAELMEFARVGVSAFHQIDARSDALKVQLKSMETEFERSKAELLEMARVGVSAYNNIETGQAKATRSAKLLAEADREVVAMQNQTSASLQRTKASVDSTATSMNRASTSTKGFGRALGSLKMMGTMVGSMIAYNFIHNLAMATTETINAKSEMNGYFQMLGYTTKQVQHFNTALDETVKKFPRLNKYALGETISSIGVEFELTTKEMEKAMPVVSMITSEYLRAGRNVNEASLAVKDILQGEFQRLSRETGVKQDTLKEAGWSGDKSDVMGLLEALDKVGKSRHWDTFVQKANSLNDAVLILQNRFSEWSADMVETVQPAILNVFNTLLAVGQSVAPILEGIWKWFNGDGLVETAVRWGSIATAITTVVTALVHYRTGANLVQMAQMGLRGSILATTLGLKAETVATYGSRNAIVSKLTSLKAEQVATLGVRKAILTKVLGLKAESVATMGLKGAIGEEVIARRIQEATMKGATVQQKMMIYNEYQEQMAKRGTLSSIFAKIAGVNMETFAEKGLTVALAERIAQSPLYVGSLKAEEVAEMSTARAGLFLMGTLTPLIAVFVGLAIAVYGLVKPLMDASEEMKKFNNLVEKGDDVIKDHKSTYDSLNKSYESANASLSEMDQNSKKYLRTQKRVETLEKDKNTAYQNWQNSIKAVEKARSSQAQFEEKRDEIAIRNQTRLADAYVKAGFSSREASEMVSHEMAEATNGAEQLRKALQMIEFESKKFRKKNDKTINMLDQYGISKDKIREYGTNLSEAQYKITEGLEKFMTSDDLMERIGGWFEIQQGRFEQWWTEFNALFEVRDWKGMGEKFQEGFLYVWEMIPWNDMLAQIGESIRDIGLVPTIMNALFGEGDSDGAVDIAWQFLNDAILTPVGDWLTWFVEDPSAHFEEVTDDLSLSLAKFLFGKNETQSVKDITDEWLKNNIVKPLQDSVTQFLTDPVGFFSDEGNEDFADAFLTQFLTKGLLGEDFSIKGYLESLPDPVHDFSVWVAERFVNFDETQVQPIIQGIKQFFGRIFSFDWLNSDGEGSGYSGMKKINVGQLLRNAIDLAPDSLNELATDIVDLFREALVNGIKSIPVVGNVADFLGLGNGDAETEAQTQGQNIGTNFTTGIQTGFAPLDGIINTAFQGLNLDGIASKFTTNSAGIVTTATSTATNVSNSYATMKNNQRTSLDSMALKNKTTFDAMKLNHTTAMNNMQTVTSTITSKVSGAFNTMKNNISSSTSKLKSNTTSDFGILSSVISAFYQNIQNPANWKHSGTVGSNVGKSYHAGEPSGRGSPSRKPIAGRKAVRRIGGKHGAGINPYTQSPNKTMSIRDLTSLVDSNEKVPIDKFLAMFSGGFGAWDFHPQHRSYIKSQAYTWDTAPASITSIGQVGHGYKVDRWKNGQASFTWDDFLATAQDIFTAIPYKFYYDSEWKGNWVNALMSGATNCSDGSDALIALANVFGFDGYKQHTTLKSGVGHFFAVINGHKMDTTNFQNHGSWSPLGGAGIPTRRANPNGYTGETQGKTVNITVSMDNAVIYGVDDLDSRIQDSVQKGIQQEFNDPYTVAI